MSQSKSNTITNLINLSKQIINLLHNNTKNDKNDHLIIPIPSKFFIFDYEKGRFIEKHTSNLTESMYEKLNFRKNLTQLTQILECLKLTLLIKLKGNAFLSKREIYYSNIQLFQSITTTNKTINTVCLLIKEERLNLQILPSAKGLFYCPLQIRSLNDDSALNIPFKVSLISNDYLTCPYYIDWSSSFCDVNFILVLEKETLFQKVLSFSFQNYFPFCIIITGKGYPDYNTRVFISNIRDMINKHKETCANSVKMMYFGDWDVFGMEIYLNYSFGSLSCVYENESIYIKGLVWIGVLYEQLDGKGLYELGSERDLKYENDFFNEETDETDESQGKEGKEETATKKRIEEILNKDYMNIDNWNTYFNSKVSLDRNDYDKFITFKSVCRLKEEMIKLYTLNLKAEADFIIQKDFNQFLYLINNALVLA